MRDPIDRRCVLVQGATAAAISAVALAAPPTITSAVASSPTAIGDLADVRAAVAALVANDAAVCAGEEAEDDDAIRIAEEAHGPLFQHFKDLTERIHRAPVVSAADIEVRAEIAWWWLRELRCVPPHKADMGDRWYDERAFLQVALAVLWLAKQGGPANE